MKPISIGGIAVSALRLDARPDRGMVSALVAAAIFGIAIISQPTLAHAAHGGGGFHGGGFHRGGFHGGGFHRDEFHGGYHGWRARGYGWSGWGYNPFISGPAFRSWY